MMFSGVGLPSALARRELYHGAYLLGQAEATGPGQWWVIFGERRSDAARGRLSCFLLRSLINAKVRDNDDGGDGGLFVRIDPEED